MRARTDGIPAAMCAAAAGARRSGRRERVDVMSSSSVVESSEVVPAPEGAELASPPPRSTYGFQKLATEFFARGAHEQYSLPYTIVRPFNCVGVGERRALRDHDVRSGNVKAPMSPGRPAPCHTVLN